MGFPSKAFVVKWTVHLTAHDSGRNHMRFRKPGPRPRFWRPALILALIAVALPATPIAAQDFRGAIGGTIKDTTGAALPGVTVTVTNVDTGVAQTLVTDGDGGFQALYLISGTYTVEANLSGFKKVVRTGNTVRVGDVLRIEMALEPGGLEETIQVTAETPLLDSSTGISGTTIDSKQIAELPLGDGTAYM